VSAQAHHLPFEQGVRIKADTDLTLESLGRWSLIYLHVGESALPVRFDFATLRDEDWFPGPHNGN